MSRVFLETLVTFPSLSRVEASMPRVVVAGSENDTSFAVIDFTNAAAPTVQLVNPGFAAGCRVAIGDHHAVAASVPRHAG